MTDQELRNEIKRNEIAGQYLLIGSEPLLIENAIRAIKEALKIDESFDFDSFTVRDTSFEEIVSRLYLTPFTSNRRLVVVKELEELDSKDLNSFAGLLDGFKNNNCLVMTYLVSKGKKVTSYTQRSIKKLLNRARCVIFAPDPGMVHNWIVKKIQRDNLNLAPTLIHYLEEEFKNDITGLKNEFEKIDNYLYEAKELNIDGIRDLARGLCDFNKYALVEDFLRGDTRIVEHFQELRPYLHSYSEIVDALTRGLVNRFQRGDEVTNDRKILKTVLDEIGMIDKGVKRSSHLVNLMIELFMLRMVHLFSKGDKYGRKAG